jgi:microcin C transport system substrate-binding protein
MRPGGPSGAASQKVSRRALLLSAAAGAAAALLPRGAVAEEVESHGLSTFGDLNYAEGFSAFDYVDPDAPKGGVFSQQVYQLVYNQNFNTFDSLHIYSLRGQGAAGVGSCFASLMTRALDEPDAMYGQAAETVRVSPDRLTYRFRLRPGLTFHDGTPIEAEDCAFSFNTLKAKGHPYISQPLQSFREAVAEGAGVVRVDLAPTRGRDLPLLVANLPIFSRRWWEGRDFEASSLERPLGSGPYRVGRFDVGKFIEIERVPDWWGHRLPTGVGINNFDVVRFEYFRDRDVAFEAFKARVFLFREETTSRFWATGYDFPAARDGRVKREELPDQTPSGAQGWFFNTRREKFKDPRVRRALGFAFDFEWTNKNIMFGSYDRTASFFQNSDLVATGKPSEAELALLEPFRTRLPAEVFGEAVLPPRSDGSGEDRKLLREATRLLREAGWSIVEGRLRNAKGDAFTIEFLDDDDSLERHTAPLIKNLSRLGIEASYRVVDAAQLQARMDAYDFDMLVRRHTMSATPGEGLRGSFSSQAAGMRGTYNLAGIADPVVDALIEAIVAAQSREALTVAGRALDRVLRAGHYWIPQWYKANHWLAYWNVYDHPVAKPRYGRAVPDIWWWKG